jgi:hypothetical protein
MVTLARLSDIDVPMLRIHERSMKLSDSPAVTRVVARGSWLVLKSALNSVVALLILTIALVGSLA